MNVWRGLLRFWLVASLVWIAFIIWIAMRQALRGGTFAPGDLMMIVAAMLGPPLAAFLVAFAVAWIIHRFSHAMPMPSISRRWWTAVMAAAVLVAAAAFYAFMTVSSVSIVRTG